ncbi:prepilin-type N-terminal cleavage/methylation domain-containing protein [Acetobacter fallax]|uniref:Prepilin-type N-terminal cleavage/methylation domain-containing protein n=1 Tax=Acetobacter fallax TaxID=1737473 RepID=A0ABX0KD59_9PROT|nr:prepilin-type N-terminal cleavage/methylation domain-containing protein [Acetobacter fallax]NHO32818.1 prepilin-type N-terminal cleavage/methylation domain-containing protein [Acetobacter fallax]NHO36398.1 prepilin-type N-terminal cleavage/methylation domain-containing protein [Acetobacter fallax]
MISHTETGEDPSQAGFTLPEIIVVLVIAGLLMGVALERGPLRSDATAFSAARSRVLGIFHDAQTLSETSGDGVSLEVSAATGHLITRHGRSVSDQKLTGATRLLLPLLNGHSAPVAFYRFTADGGASGPPVVLTLGNHACIISLSPVTGRISASES